MSPKSAGPAGPSTEVPTPITTSEWPQATELVEGLVGAGSGTVLAVLIYGSHLHRTNPDRHSALDLIVIVSEYRRFYTGLKAAGALNRPVGLMSTMANVLPPNVIAYTVGGNDDHLGKCLIVSKAHLSRALGPRPRDHFLLGRLIQRVGIVWAASEGDRVWVEEALGVARSRVLTWMAPYLTEPVDAEELGRRMLEVCYRGELRPEATNRSDQIFDAQAEHFRDTLAPVLVAAAAAGEMVEEDGRYRLATPVGASERRRWRWHFARSRIRSTTRWLKHTVTFDNWLPYVVRKAERHTGTTIELTGLEQRWPLLFLWPRAIRLLRSRSSERGRQIDSRRVVGPE